MVRNGTYCIFTGMHVKYSKKYSKLKVKCFKNKILGRKWTWKVSPLVKIKKLSDRLETKNNPNCL